MATDPFNPLTPADTDFVGEPAIGAQVHLRDIKTVLKDWLARIPFKNVVNAFTAAQAVTPVAIPFVSNPTQLTVNAAQSNCLTLTLNGNASFGLLTNFQTGQHLMIRIMQDGIGNRTVTYVGAQWKFPQGARPVATPAANAVDLLYVVNFAGNYHATYIGDLR